MNECKVFTMECYSNLVVTYIVNGSLTMECTMECYSTMVVTYIVRVVVLWNVIVTLVVNSNLDSNLY